MFSYEHDGELKKGLKRRCEFKSLMSQAPFSDLEEAIRAAIKEETTGSADAAENNDEDADATIVAIDINVLALDELPEMKKVLKKAEGDDEKSKQLAYWKNYAKRLVEAHVDLVAESENDDTICQRFKDSAAGKVKGRKEDKSHVLFSYNPNLCGEASSQPCSRKPPLRQAGDHLRRLCSIFMRAREYELDERDIWCFFDGGREGTRMKNMMCYRARNAMKFKWDRQRRWRMWLLLFAR